MQNWENTSSGKERGSAGHAHGRRRRFGNLLIGAGILLALVPLFTVAYGLIEQWALQREWGREYSTRAAEQRKAAERGIKSDIEDAVLSEGVIIPASSSPGGKLPTTKIKIPAIGVDQVLSEGTGTEELKKGPGHYRGMALPGERGNVGIAGHRVTWTKPFNRLDELDPGDTVVLETFERRFEYRVVESRVLDPKDTSMLRPTSDARVTLTTCNPKYSARTRLDVQAVLVRTTDKSPSAVRLITAIGVGSGAKRNADDKARPKVRFAPKSELELARILVEEHPRDPESRLKLGVLLMGAGSTQEATAEFVRVDRLSPQSPFGPYYLGLISRNEGNSPDAARLLSSALDRDKDFEPALFELGVMLTMQGEVDEAIGLLERAAALSPLDAETLRALAEAYELTGDNAGALEAYEGVLRFLPEDQRSRSAVERLRRK